MIRFVLAASVALVAAPAFADGHASAASTDVMSTANTTDWSGWYAGAQYDFLDGDASLGGGVEGDVSGLFAGYRHDYGDIVVGVELDYSVGDFESTVVPGVILDVDSLMRLGIEVGYDAGPALVYATLGYTAVDLSLAGVDAGDGDGVYYGLGLDYMVSERVSLGVELLRHDFNNINGQGWDFNTVGLNIAYRF